MKRTWIRHWCECGAVPEHDTMWQIMLDDVPQPIAIVDGVARGDGAAIVRLIPLPIVNADVGIVCGVQPTVALAAKAVLDDHDDYLRSKN